MLRSYGKIYNLGHAAISDLLDGEVVVEEKVDGSQFSFGRLGCGGIFFRSRSQNIDRDAPDKMFANGIAAILPIAEELQEGWTYRGEYLMKPKHNTLAYDRIPQNHVIIFDIDTGMESYLDPEAKAVEAARLGFEVVPVLLKGALTSYDAFSALLHTKSVLGGQTIEGVVIKNYSRFGRDGHVLMGKFVSETFKEMNGADWRTRNPVGKDIIASLTERVKTPARWEKAVQHLREAGNLTDSPKDIGPLLRELCADTEKECAEELKDALWKWAWKGIGRGLTHGFAEWYKEKLAKQQFEAVPSADEVPTPQIGGDASVAGEAAA